MKRSKQAKKLVDEDRAASVSLGIGQPVSSEENPDAAETLSRAPCAIPLPGKIIMEKGLRVSDVPAGILLDRYSGDLDVRTSSRDVRISSLDVRISDPAAPKSDLPSRRYSGSVETISKPQARQVFISAVAQPTIAEQQKGKRVPGSKSGHEEDRVALIRAPRAETNLGKNPESRSYIRGVLHTHPWHLRLGAVFSLLLLINLPLAVVSAFLLLASQEKPEIFAWVPEWMLGFPIALPVTGVGYMIWGLTGKCRICNQKLFAHKGALKHLMAHRIKGMGFIVPLSLHLLAFNWFRCSSCGTPVRLKK